MPIVALGVDLVDVDRFRWIEERGDPGALARMFTGSEMARARLGVHRGEQLAGWFSAKEAVLKALGVGQSQGVAWTDVEVTTNSVGAPGVSLQGRAGAIADELGIDHWLVSISHTATYATATAIGVSA